MCGPDCWCCPCFSQGELRDSTYTTVGGETRHEYNWSCRQKVCCVMWIALGGMLAIVLLQGAVQKTSNQDSGNSTNSSFVFNTTNFSYIEMDNIPPIPNGNYNYLKVPFWRTQKPFPNLQNEKVGSKRSPLKKKRRFL